MQRVGGDPVLIDRQAFSMAATAPAAFEVPLAAEIQTIVHILSIAALDLKRSNEVVKGDHQ